MRNFTVRIPFGLFGLLVVAAVPPTRLEAQGAGTWIIIADVGRYEVHEGSPGFRAAPAGVLLGVTGGRQWGSVRLQLGIGQGVGDDAFTALQPGVALVLPHDSPIRVVVGGGAGFLWEFSTASLPYYGEFGIEAVVGERSRVRGLIRRGAHANLGDPGTFRGPHTITLGFVWSR